MEVRRRDGRAKSEIKVQECFYEGNEALLAKVPDPVDKWGRLWGEMHNDEIAMLDTPRETPGVARTGHEKTLEVSWEDKPEPAPDDVAARIHGIVEETDRAAGVA